MQGAVDSAAFSAALAKYNGASSAYTSEATSVTAYGKTAGPGRTALVYDATNRHGPPLLSPKAATLRAADSTEVFFADRSTVRVMNLAPKPAVFGVRPPLSRP